MDMALSSESRTFHITTSITSGDEQERSRQSIDRIRKAWRTNSTWLTYELPEERVLRLVFEIPLVAINDLKSAVLCKLPSVMHVDPEVVCLDYKIVGRRATSLFVDVAVVHRDTIAGIVEALAKMSLRIDALFIEGDAENRINFIRTKRARLRSAIMKAGIVCAIVAGLALLVCWPYYTRAQEIERLRALLEDARRTTRIFEARQKEVDHVIAMEMRVREAVDKIDVAGIAALIAQAAPSGSALESLMVVPEEVSFRIAMHGERLSIVDERCSIAPVSEIIAVTESDAYQVRCPIGVPLQAQKNVPMNPPH